MSTDTATPRFRWRIIPAGFLIGMGGLMLLGSTAGFLMLVFVSFRSGLPSRGLYQSVVGLGLMQVAALCLIAAGRLIMSRRWGWMSLALLMAYVAGVYGTKLMEESRTPAVPLYRISDLGR